MQVYLVVEMLPFEEVIYRPNGEFSAGKGFESTLAEFSIMGPYVKDSAEFEDDYFKYYDEGYLIDLVCLEPDSENRQ